MREAVIVSTARTPIGKAYRGAFNNMGGAELGAHAIKAAVERAGLDPAEVEDVVLGAAMPKGATGNNIARQAALCAGLPVGRIGRPDYMLGATPLLCSKAASYVTGAVIPLDGGAAEAT